jgi:hypothetical protein
MNQPSNSTVPDYTRNHPLFESVYKLVCTQADADCQSPEAVLAQIIYHASYEMFYSDDVTLALVQSVVEAAALVVAKEYEDAGDFEQSLIGSGGGVV